MSIPHISNADGLFYSLLYWWRVSFACISFRGILFVGEICHYFMVNVFILMMSRSDDFVFFILLYFIFLFMFDFCG